MKTIRVYPVFRADSEYDIIFNQIANFSDRNRLNTMQKPIRSGLLRSILKIFMGFPRFFLDVFIPFCSFSKELSNEIKISVDRGEHSC